MRDDLRNSPSCSPTSAHSAATTPRIPATAMAAATKPVSRGACAWETELEELAEVEVWAELVVPTEVVTEAECEVLITVSVSMESVTGSVSEAVPVSVAVAPTGKVDTWLHDP